MPDEVLEEIVKEGQLMLASLFQSYLGLMTRGFTMAGLVLTGTTAFIAASISMRSRAAAAAATSFDAGQVLFAGLLLIGSLLALVSALPGRYSIPGNEPRCWNLEHWDLPPGDEPTRRGALLSQATVLQSQLTKNRVTNRNKAWLQIASFLTTFAAVVVGASKYLGV